jgi:CBS domain-containing protein
MHRDTALPTRRLEAGTSIAQARPWSSDPVTLDSPALAVMTDLTQVKAAMIPPGAPLRQAEQTMIYQGVRMLFVVSELPTVEGLVTTNDLHGDHALAVVQQRGIRYDEIVVGDVMTRLSMLEAIEFDALRSASVGNLVATLKKHGRNHLLVVEGTPPRVRGVVSRAQIERQIGSVIEIVEVANTFADVGRMLA